MLYDLNLLMGLTGQSSTNQRPAISRLPELLFLHAECIIQWHDKSMISVFLHSSLVQTLLKHRSNLAELRWNLAQISLSNLAQTSFKVCSNLAQTSLKLCSNLAQTSLKLCSNLAQTSLKRDSNLACSPRTALLSPSVGEVWARFERGLSEVWARFDWSLDEVWARFEQGLSAETLKSWLCPLNPIKRFRSYSIV